MKLKNIYQHSVNLTACFAKINELLEEKHVAMSNIEFWSSREDLHNNLENSFLKIPKIDGMILFQQEQIKQIIKQLTEEAKNECE